MRPRDERAHPVVKDAIESGYINTGKYYEVRGFASEAVAQDSRRSIYAACRHLNVSCSSRSGEDVLEMTDSTWMVRFRIFTKEHGRAHVLAQSGGDPSKLAWNPFERGETAVVDDSGRRTG